MEAIKANCIILIQLLLFELKQLSSNDLNINLSYIHCSMELIERQLKTKEVKVWKTRFWKNITKLEGGAQAQAIKNVGANEVCIASQTVNNGRMWGITTPQNLLTLLENNNGIYDLITKFPHKIYFDIDNSGKGCSKSNEDPNDVPFGTTFLKGCQYFKDLINEVFPDADMAISGSITDVKESYHITLNNYMIHNEEERTQVKMIVKHLQTKDSAFDWKVYTKNRQMKSVNQSKLDGRVQCIIENDDIKKHCIMCWFNTYVKPLPIMSEEVEQEIQIEKAKAPFDIGSLPKLILNIPAEVDYTNLTPFQILQLLPLNENFQFSYCHLVARFCYYNGLTFEQYMSWLQNKAKSVVAKRQQEWTKLSKFPPVSIDQIKQILVYYYPQIKKDISYRDFVQTFNIPQEIIRPVETMSQDCFNGTEKYSVFNIGMGGGKTAQTIDYLQFGSFCWIAPNQALALNTQLRLEDKEINVCHYKNNKLTTKQKQEGGLNAEDKLIIVLNSLHYLSRKYDIVVIDEIETLLDKFLGDFMEGDNLTNQLKMKIWNQLKYMLQNAKKVILLDAFITNKTIGFIKSLEPNATIHTYIRINEPQTRTIHYMKDFEMTLYDAITKIKSGSKIFIFYPYKRDSCNWSSMENIYSLICEQTGRKGIFYNADVGDKTKAGLKDVNSAWADKSFVLTNNIITCGVNYEGLDFDYKYLFIASFNTPRDVIQVSYRARHLSTGIIKVCYMGKMNQSNAWLSDCAKMDCPVYTALYNSILVEKKAPLKRAFQLFCVKAHYKQVVDETVIVDAIKKEVQDELEKQHMGMSYASIEDITYDSVKDIQQACLAQIATMRDKMMLQKYFYKKEFLETAVNVVGETFAINMMALGWETNSGLFFKQLKYVFLHPECVFNKIMRLNKLDTIFPTDVKKTKLDANIIEQIFTEFTFKNISRTSSPYKIIKEIYNVYFNKCIYSTNYKSDEIGVGRCDYYITCHINDFYTFAKEYMVLDKGLNLTFNNCQNTDDDEDSCVAI